MGLLFGEQGFHGDLRSYEQPNPDNSHLDQVLLTFGLIYIFEEMRSILWGDDVHGVPVPVKDLNLTRGVRTTLGSKLYASNVPQHDAVAVQRRRVGGVGGHGGAGVRQCGGAAVRVRGCWARCGVRASIFSTVSPRGRVRRRSTRAARRCR